MDYAAETIPRKVGLKKGLTQTRTLNPGSPAPLISFCRHTTKTCTHDGGWVDKSKLQMKNIHVFTDKVTFSTTNCLIFTYYCRLHSKRHKRARPPPFDLIALGRRTPPLGRRDPPLGINSGSVAQGYISAPPRRRSPVEPRNGWRAQGRG